MLVVCHSVKCNYRSLFIRIILSSSLILLLINIVYYIVITCLISERWRLRSAFLFTGFSDPKPAKVVSSCINALGCIYTRREYSALLAIKSFLVQHYTGEIYISKINRLSSRERLFLLVFSIFLIPFMVKFY